MGDLEPQLKAALRAAWQETTANGTGLAEDAFGDATARAELVYEVVRFFYDEAKFRTPGPAEEREELAKVGDAARGYADAMFALRSRPDGM
ncbi:hypothetical protein ACFXKW_27330 [Streptomyces sp. NPDC059193]|uniref:hypothetical protein n=1 Tax=Streptomyces sp. NPDC059193 TaxID=3346763 RepID=UPI0036B68234